jgi:hypothetical protein
MSFSPHHEAAIVSRPLKFPPWVSQPHDERANASLDDTSLEHRKLSKKKINQRFFFEGVRGTC